MSGPLTYTNASGKKICTSCSRDRSTDDMTEECRGCWRRRAEAEAMLDHPPRLDRAVPCLLCGALLGKHRDSCPIFTVKPWNAAEPGMQTTKIIEAPPKPRPSPVKLVPAFVQRLWLDGLSLHKIALALGSTPQEVEDVMRKRTARLVRERAR